jgi:hypothetical protein
LEICLMDLKQFSIEGLSIYTADQLDGYGLMAVSDATSVFKHLLNGDIICFLV